MTINQTSALCTLKARGFVVVATTLQYVRLQHPAHGPGSSVYVKKRGIGATGMYALLWSKHVKENYVNGNGGYEWKEERVGMLLAAI